MEERKVVKCKVILECEVEVCPQYYGDSLEDAVEETLSCDLWDYVTDTKIEEIETYYTKGNFFEEGLDD